MCVQAMIQLSALGISLGVAVVAGVITGFIINIEFFCSGMKDTELFEDFFFFQTPYELEEETAAEPLPSIPAFPPMSVPPPPVAITPSKNIIE